MFTIREIATLFEGEIIGNSDITITKPAKIEEAINGSISFISNPKYEKYIEQTSATAILVSLTFNETQYEKLPPAVIKVADPYSAFVILLEKFYPSVEQLPHKIHPTAIISNTAMVGENCAIGPYVVIGERCIIGKNVTIFPHVVIGNDVKIGEDTIIYQNVSIREECIIGSRVILQPGVVIGGDGFGFAPKKDGTYQKIPQRGIVVIEDDVEIQSHTCIDRATLGETRIQQGAKLDNFVQIAHNVIVGKNTVIAAHTAVAGSVKIGNNVRIGGNSSIAGHLSIADNTTIMGSSGVTKSIIKEGDTYFGHLVKEVHRAKKIEAVIRQLPELLSSIQQLQFKIEELEKKK